VTVPFTTTCTIPSAICSVQKSCPLAEAGRIKNSHIRPGTFPKNSPIPNAEPLRRKNVTAEVLQPSSSLPAERFGIRDRGVLRKGAWADVAVFDPARFGERGTIFEPNQIAEGMVHVVVNGTVTLEDGQLTGERNGQLSGVEDEPG